MSSTVYETENCWCVGDIVSALFSGSSCGGSSHGKGSGQGGEDLFPYLKVPLDVRCLGMKLNHWNIISAELPTIYDSERSLFLLCTNFMSAV